MREKLGLTALATAGVFFGGALAWYGLGAVFSAFVVVGMAVGLLISFAEGNNET